MQVPKLLTNILDNLYDLIICQYFVVFYPKEYDVLYTKINLTMLTSRFHYNDFYRKEN